MDVVFPLTTSLPLIRQFQTVCTSVVAAIQQPVCSVHGDFTMHTEVGSIPHHARRSLLEHYFAGFCIKYIQSSMVVRYIDVPVKQVKATASEGRIKFL
ncbi:MAG: hypothetical protein J5I59_06075 [Saprospiraceae bacterium]|nr:hypothetical protein [Saprospiraceae bacterium]